MKLLHSVEMHKRSIRVNFHCHSNCSDGSLSPEQVAEELAASGVCFAALTDHDSIDGLRSFDQVLASHGIGLLTGVEITVEEAPESFHILAYGFDPENGELLEILRRRRANRRNGLREDMNKLGTYLKTFAKPEEIPSEGNIMVGAAEVIRAIHHAGGTAFLAHPLTACPDFESLEKWLVELKQLKLDGIEAYYAEYSEPVREALAEIADRHSLLTCAGTDFHGYDQPGLNQIAFDMPLEHWTPFRRTHNLPISDEGGVSAKSSGHTQSSPPLRKRLIRPKNPSLQWRRFALRIVFPTLLAVGLSIATIFGLILPALEKNLMDRKREMIRELVYSAMSILAHYEADAQAGLISRPEAQKRAISHIEFLRYGLERKDYFWVTDMHPRMIMHPYRKDLNGTDLSDFMDVRGSRLFVEFVKVARERNEGFVEYYWQWKDNPDRVVPKQSFVKLFGPWNWVIGTGIYLDDVNQEIDNMTGWLVRLCLGICAVIILLLAYITRESLAIERRRSKSEADLQESHEKYAALVEATTEGTLMVLNERCAYSNSTMAETLGYTEEELSKLDFRNLFPPETNESNSALMVIDAALRGEQPPAQFEADLLRKNGERFRALCSLTRIALGGKTGFILVVRDISSSRILEGELSHSRERFKVLAEKIEIGVFRISAGRHPVFWEANQAARNIFGISDHEDLTSRELLPLIPDETERERISAVIDAGSEIQNRTVDISRREGALLFVSVSLLPFRDETGAVKYYDGIVEDKTLQKRSERERDALLGELQSELLFMNEPLKDFAHDLLLCDMNASIREATETMSLGKASVLGITAGEEGTVIGILTDWDLRDRVLSAGADLSHQVHSIMSAPVISLPDDATVFEAILKMEQMHVRHLALRRPDGHIRSLIGSSDLMRLHRYSAAVIVREIKSSTALPDIVDAKKRLPWLIKTLLDCGAKPRIVSRMMTRVSDSIAERLLELAVQEIGPPPVPFCFMALGSEGRGEQTLVTDQDNALIYGSSNSETDETLQKYFLRLGEIVSYGLNQAGYVFCSGEVMARNSKWNRPLQDWKHYFRDWIMQANPQDLLEFNTFFDFRCIWGEWELALELRKVIRSLIAEHPPFLLHFAQNALLYKPPIGLFGKIVAETGGEIPKAISLKEATLPIVNFARLYALRHGVSETNTLDRLQRLFELQIIRKGFFDEIVQAYSFLMEIRLRNQAFALAANRKPDNLLDLETVSTMEETLLKESFSVISTIRKKISFDFLGQA
ncbi:MAG: cache domain-containing protein [Acidobacteria bacterium]|nr:cache domain-containing protein [Acidobacteriota bacterium]